MSKISTTISLVMLIYALAACDQFYPAAPADQDILDGPIGGLTKEQNTIFLAGDIAFNDEIFSPATGLGPIFVAASCGSCHAGDGKGHPFTSLTRFGQQDSTGNQFLHLGGPQMQNRAIPGFSAERLPTGVAFSTFTPPAVTGLGLLAALTDEQLLANADPMDSDQDGISGVPNYITAPDYFQLKWFHQPRGGKYIGRFGKKAGAIDLLHQTVNAYKQDMGITSDFDMEDPINYAVADQSGDNVPDPEVPASTVRSIVLYLRTLKSPIVRNADNPVLLEGKGLFTEIGCGNCHTPEWKTPDSDISALSNKVFHPYTDLLLHDMGPALDDGYTEGTALTSEWRTPPLWGLGLSQNSQGGQYFLMHDGRAHSIEAAILYHGGEGERSKTAFQLLGEAEKEKLIQFLKSL